MSLINSFKKAKSYFFHIAFFLVTIIWVYPIIWTISASLKTSKDLYNGSISLFPPDFHWSYFLPSNWGLLSQVFHFENYSRAWYVAEFEKYFLNTAILTVLVVALVIFLCGLTGYALGRYSFPGKKIIIGAIVATQFIPHGYTIIPVWQLINALGLKQSLFGLVLAEAGGAHTIYILLFTAYFSKMPKELEEAAKLDGAGFLRTFVSVMLPMAKPVVATTFILQFIQTWNSFFIPLIFTISRPSLRTLSVGLQSFVGQYSSDLAGMAAGAAISIVPVIIVFILFQKYFIEGVAGSMKG